MTTNLTRKLWLCVGLWLTLVASGAVSAQDNKNTFAPSVAPSVAAAATTEQARFLADNEVTNIRLEVFTLSDTRLYDSDFKAGNLLDWRWQDQQGQALTDGAYRCLLTVKDLTGHSSQRQGVLVIQNGAASWQAPEQAEAALRTTTAARAAEGIAYFATVTNPAELTAAVLAHDGKEARLLTGSGGLSVRTGNFLKGEEQEKLKLTEEGKLEIKGLISTGEGIAFPDGTVQKTAYVASGQTLKQIAEDGKKLSPNAPAVGGSGTPGKLMKWAANGVDATDSTVTDLGPGGGISVNGSVQSTFYNVSASGTFMALWPAIPGSAMLLRSASFSGNIWIGHLGNIGLNASEPASRFATGGGATIGAGYYNTAAPTNGLLVEGSVGIGQTSGLLDKLTVSANLPSGFAVYGGNNGLGGVYGVNFSTTAGSYGVLGESIAPAGYGVYGVMAGSTARGVYGKASAATGINYGVYGQTASTSSGASGVYGIAIGTAGFNYGVLGVSDSSGGTGVQGRATVANANATGVWGIATAPAYAGYFTGNVTISGTLSKGSGSFKIDHPLDPENKYLYHSFVESPDMKNIYDGNIMTDANGDALVTMPDWFEPLNRDFRYQLTVIGQFAQAIVAEEMSHNSFKIKTNLPNVKVSWQVTGIRQDAFARKHPIPVEVDKPEAERGSYLHPDAFDKVEEQGVEWKLRPEAMKEFKAQREAARQRQANPAKSDSNADIESPLKRRY